MSSVVTSINRCINIVKSISNQTISVTIRNYHCPRVKFGTKPSILCCARARSMYRHFAKDAGKAMSSYAGKEKDYIFRQLMEYKSFTYTYLLADPQTKEAVLIDPVLETVDRDVKIVTDLGLNLVYGSCMTFVWHEKGIAFTGDAMLIRGCGRTDFQEGNSGVLYDSVHGKIFTLPPEFNLYPAHDYTGQTVTTVAEEKQMNPRLSKPKEEFVKIMENLKLPYPSQIAN
ncbi:ETHE1-like protein [Mya arenaria]|uniref:ETHE1-like protein n=1 Tax=Mya arenaria TaxID=6604 RepID=A0ABY7E344_MYAAR|nr:ETHE1-like protein [Mya arenaria]